MIFPRYYWEFALHKCPVHVQMVFSVNTNIFFIVLSDVTLQLDLLNNDQSHPLQLEHDKSEP